MNGLEIFAYLMSIFFACVAVVALGLALGGVISGIQLLLIIPCCAGGFSCCAQLVYDVYDAR